MKIKLKFLILLIIACTVIKGQDLTGERPFWLNFSLGGYPEYIGGGVSFNKTFEDFSYQVSINGNGKLDNFPFNNSGMTSGVIGLGKAYCQPWLIASVHGGPSLSYGEANASTGEFVNFWGTGLALNAQVYFMPYKVMPGIGIGLDLFYNYNIMQTKDTNYRHTYLLRLGVTFTNIHDKPK